MVALQDSEANARSALKGTDPNLPVLLDEPGRLASSYGVRAVPTTFVIDGEGRIVDVRVGGVTAAELQAMVDAAR